MRSSHLSPTSTTIGSRKTARRLPHLMILGTLLITLIIGTIAGAPLLTRYDPTEQSAAIRLHSPNRTHLLGTDRYGRDVLARILYGGRITLVAGGVALLLVVTIGLVIGAIAGYYGGWIDMILMRLVDVLQAFPSIVLALVIVGLFGANLVNILLAIVSVWWVAFARIARSIVLRVKHEPFVEAAHALGVHPFRILWREIIPHTAGPVFVLATLELGSMLLSIAGLSFLGLGAQPPSPEWGAMLADGRAYMMTYPHLVIAPALMIFLTVFALNLIGEGMRDWLDPAGVTIK